MRDGGVLGRVARCATLLVLALADVTAPVAAGDVQVLLVDPAGGRLAFGETLVLRALRCPLGVSPSDPRCETTRARWRVTDGRRFVTLSRDRGQTTEVRAREVAGLATIEASIPRATSIISVSVFDPSTIPPDGGPGPGPGGAHACEPVATTTRLLAFASGGSTVPGSVIYAVTADGELVTFDPTRPSPSLPIPITGLGSGDRLLGIGFRPDAGTLVGVGAMGGIYEIIPATGAATSSARMSTPPRGSEFGFDFDPTVDRIRITTDAGQDLLVDRVDGATSAAERLLLDGSDVTGSVAGLARSGSTLFAIELTSLSLSVVQSAGTLVRVGDLGVSLAGRVGFDSSVDGSNVLTSSSQGSGASTVFRVDFRTGEACVTGTVAYELVDVAIGAPPPREPGPVAFGVTPGNDLITFDALAPGDFDSIPVTGLGDDTLIGLDVGASSDVLVGITKAWRLATIDATTGAATLGPQVAAEPGSSAFGFGFDLDPALDVFRVASDGSHGLVIDPSDGSVRMDVPYAYDPADANAGTTPNIVGLTTGQGALSGATEVFAIDASTGMLVKVDTLGVLSTLGRLPGDVSVRIGFDAAGAGLAVMSRNTPESGVTGIYAITLDGSGGSPIGAVMVDLVDIAIAAPEAAGPGPDLTRSALPRSPLSDLPMPYPPGTVPDDAWSELADPTNDLGAAAGRAPGPFDASGDLDLVAWRWVELDESQAQALGDGIRQGPIVAGNLDRVDVGAGDYLAIGLHTAGAWPTSPGEQDYLVLRFGSDPDGDPRNDEPASATEPRFLHGTQIQGEFGQFPGQTVEALSDLGAPPRTDTGSVRGNLTPDFVWWAWSDPAAVGILVPREHVGAWFTVHVITGRRDGDPAIDAVWGPGTEFPGIPTDGSVTGLLSCFRAQVTPSTAGATFRLDLGGPADPAALSSVTARLAPDAGLGTPRLPDAATVAQGGATYSWIVPGPLGQYLVDFQANDASDAAAVTYAGALGAEIDRSARGTTFEFDGTAASEFSSDPACDASAPASTGPLAGDFDGDGAVDAADYVRWRSQRGTSVDPGSGADGTADGLVDDADYDVWRRNFGATS